MLSAYEMRAAAVVLLFSELFDEAAPAEECVDEREFGERRERLRGNMRAFLDRAGGASQDRWVRRAFLSSPPKRGHLDLEWKERLVEWVLHLGLDRDARHDLELAVRALFSDGDASRVLLVARRPNLAPTIARVLTPILERWPILDQRFTDLLADSIVPAYVTCPDLDKILWSNRSFQSLFGLAADRVRTMSVADLVGVTTSLMREEDQPSFLSRQEAVLHAGRAVGRGHVEAVVDLDRRTWLHGIATLPWSGRVRIVAEAHVVLDAADQRLGSVVLLSVCPAQT